MSRRGLLVAFILLNVLLLLWPVMNSSEYWVSFKPYLIPAVNLYLDVFNSPSTAFALSFLMILSAVSISIYYYFVVIRRPLKDLRDLSAQLNELTREPHGNTVLQLDTALASHPRFARAWRLYRNAISVGEGGSGTSPTPSRYFNVTMLEQTGFRTRFFLGLPNDYVGIGLVFTFLGLVAGLYFASRSMMTADLTEARVALVHLLNAATFKFLTSIVGISISLVMGAWQRVIMGRVHFALLDIQLLLEEQIAVPTAQNKP